MTSVALPKTCCSPIATWGRDMHSLQFCHRITLQRKEQTQNPLTGALITTWVTEATVWAAVEPLSAREFIAAQAVQSDVSVRITVRYRPGITAAMRLLHDGKVYGITGVLADKGSGREYLTLPCAELPHDGI